MNIGDPVIIAAIVAALAGAYKLGGLAERVDWLRTRSDKNAHEVGSAWIQGAAEIKAMRAEWADLRAELRCSSVAARPTLSPPNPGSTECGGDAPDAEKTPG